MPSTERTYTTVFNLRDNLTRKFDKIQELLKGFEEKTYRISIEFDSETVGRLNALNDKLENSFGGVTRAAQETQKATNQTTQAMKGASDATNQNTDAGKKHSSLLQNLKGQYDGLTNSIGGLKDKLAGLTGLLTGGAIMGYSWQAATEKSLYQSQMLGMLGNLKGAKRPDMAAVLASMDEASRSGYSSSTERLSIINQFALRGGKQRSVGAAESIEKIYYSQQEFLRNQGLAGSAEDLASLATSPYIRGKAMKEMLNSFFGQYGIKGFAGKTQAQRIKLLANLDLDIDMDEEKAKRPLAVIQKSISNISKAVGKELSGPMNAVANVLAGIVEKIASSPVLSKILAWGAAFATVAGGLITVIGLLPTLKSGFMAVGAGMKMLGMAGGAGGLTALMNPYVALAAIAAIILIVAYRTGYLQKAWDKFTKSAIGKDIIDGIKSVSDWVGQLINRFQAWYDATGRSQILTVFSSIADVLGTAWDYADKIYSKMRGAGTNPLLALSGALLGGSAGLIMGVASKAAGKSPDELLEILVGYSQNILRWLSSSIAPFTAKIHDVLKKVHSIFEWIYSLWQGFWNWAKSAVPGAEKAAKQKEIERLAGKITAPNDGRVSFDPVRGKFRMTDKFGSISDYTPEKDSKLEKRFDEWKKLPGFAEGIADAVRNGLEGIGGVIGQAVKDALSIDIEIPYLKDLVESVNQLVQSISNWADNVLPGQADRAKTKSNNALLEQQGIRIGAYGMWEVLDERGNWVLAGPDERKRADAIYDEIQASLAASRGHASGLTFKRTGIYTGKFHGPEEVLPRATTVQGPGIIAKAMAALDARASTSGSGGKVDVHVHNANDFSNMKVASGVDVDALLKKIDRRIETGSVEAVKKALGQGRT